MAKRVSLNEKERKWYVPVIVLFFAIALFLLLFNNVRQQEMNLSEGEIADKTIRANKTIENTYETEAKQKLAMQAVTPEYSYDDTLGATQLTNISDLFKMVDQIQKDSANSDKTTEEKIAILKGKFDNLSSTQALFYKAFPQSFYEKLFSLSTDDCSQVEKAVTTVVSQYMGTHIRQNTLSNTKQNALKDLNYYGLDDDELEVAKILVNEGIVVNEVANAKKTEELKEKAKDSVAPVMIYQGEIVVREGTQIDAKAMQKLKLLGLTDRKTAAFPVEALVLAIMLQVLILLYAMNQMMNRSQRFRFVTFYVILMLVAITLMKLLQLFQKDATTFIPFLFPIAFTPLVLNIFVNRRTAVMSAMFQTIFAMFVFYQSVGTSSILIILLTYTFVGILATLVKRKRISQQPGSAFLWLLAFPMLLQVLLMIYQGMNFTEALTWKTLGSMGIGAMLSYILTLGLHPYIELILTDDSAIVLNELSNPNQPLLKQLLEKAPGTYHHSMMVANLSANAVAEIGGNAMATRVACYYHDIGKMKHANFFVENLPAGAENPHNFLLPEDSKRIIFGHVEDGIQMLKDAHMPQIVIDICGQHHGTTLMRYFYVEAKKRNPEVTEEEFRYPGCKPQTKEAAVVSIADSSEAAVRAMEQPTGEKIKSFVHDLINTRIEDGQFDECDITMENLRQVETSLVNGLISSFHSRIKYPELNKDEKQSTEEGD